MNANVQSASRKKIRIGDLLVEHGVINQQQLDIALKQQQKLGRKLGQTLISLGYIDESSLINFLSKQLSLPVVDLKHFDFDVDIVRRMSEAVARRYRALILKEKKEFYVIGMADPSDIYAYDEIVRHLGRPIKLAIVSESELLDTFDLVYRRTSEISNLAEKLGQELSEGDDELAQLFRADSAEDVPVAKLLRSIFEDAVQVGASDIHIEPDETVLRIRQRIDGVLQEQIMKEKNIAPAVVLRLKLMGGLDISEKRIPQDGRFNIRLKNHNIDVRLSTMPVQYGESVVMRLLDQTGSILSLENLGMPEVMLKHFRQAINKPHGLILVTGPTGSGKTTTLYSALQELNKPEKKIITAEDPVEYRLPRISQVQVKHKIGLNFVGILRSALRQDPDVILIGEMRDQETVEIALRAAMTGHLVLTTLHTNDAVSTADRLLDMGAEGFLIASSLRAIIAQRLMRRICASCQQHYTLRAHESVWLKASFGDAYDTVKTMQGIGCSHCNNTGYHGRIGVYEFLEPNHAMLDALKSNDLIAFEQAAKKNKSYKPMIISAMSLVKSGITTVEEVMRISAQRADDDFIGEFNLTDEAESKNPGLDKTES